MTVERPFASLMDDLRRGDPEAAGEVFHRFAQRLAGLAASRLPPLARAKLDPEDVAQSVLCSFFRRHGDGEFTPAHWDALWSLLAVLAVRKCGHKLEHLFAAKRDARREIVQPDTSTNTSQPGWTAADPAPTPVEAAIFEETLAQVLSGLKERERPVVILRLEGYDIAEIAEQVGCSERTVHRVLESVRERLQGPVEE